MNKIKLLLLIFDLLAHGTLGWVMWLISPSNECTHHLTVILTRGMRLTVGKNSDCVRLSLSVVVECVSVLNE